MNRKMYVPTDKQESNWARLTVYETPSDEVFKHSWAKSHNGKEAGWGMGKRDWIIRNMCQTREYQMGLWQGRVDAAQGLEYSEERNEKTYNVGYYRGYLSFDSYRARSEWGHEVYVKFMAEYGPKEEVAA
jgi:hypothetical protein